MLIYFKEELKRQRYVNGKQKEIKNIQDLIQQRKIERATILKGGDVCKWAKRSKMQFGLENNKDISKQDSGKDEIKSNDACVTVDDDSKLEKLKISVLKFNH